MANCFTGRAVVPARLDGALVMQNIGLPFLERTLLAAMVLTIAAMVYGTWRDEYFWQTANQRAYDDYQRRDYASAERRFQDPQWKAAACYRRGEFICAAEVYATTDGAEAAYNLGNALAYSRKSGSLTAALAGYQKALNLRSDWPLAKHNQRVIADLLIAQNANKKSDDDGDPGEPNEPPDGNVVDDKAKAGKSGEINIEKLDPNAIEQLWLRNVKTDPAAFLRLRFAAEQATRPVPKDANP